MVRPLKYNVKIFDSICERIAEGESLNKITKEAAYPMKITFYRWLRESPSLCNQYDAAKKDRADTYADEMVDIADQKHFSTESIQAAKLRIDTRKWIACKLHPRNYGDSSSMQLTGKDGESLAAPIINILPVAKKSNTEEEGG